MKSLKFLAVLALVALMTIVLGVGSAQAALDTNFPSASGLMDGVSGVFNPALGWVIGASAVLLAIGWVKRAARR